MKANVRISLRSKLVALTATLSVIPLGAVGWFLIDVNRAAVEELQRDVQIAALDDLARTIDQELGGAEDALESIAHALADPDAGEEARLGTALALIGGHGSIDHVRVFDAEGESMGLLREEGGASEPPPETLPSELRDEIEERGVATGEVQRSERGPRVLLALRIRAGERTTGYVASYVSLAEVQHRVERLAQGRFRGRANSLFVVDEQLRVIAHTDAERAATLASARDEGALANVNPRALSADVARSGEYAAADGTAMLGSTVGLEGRPWALVAQIPQEVAYASLNRMRWTVMATIAGVILLALLASIWFSRMLTGGLRQLMGYVKALAARDWEAKLELSSTDEIGLLGGALQRAAGQLAESEVRITREVAIRNDLGRYVPGDLVDAIVRRETDMRLGGERREVTILFADVVGFTPIAQKLAPEEVVTVLNELFTILTGIVFKHGGTIDKFVGDCVMAVFNAPTRQADHASRALSTAEDMLSYLEAGAETWRERYGIDVKLAIAVHTGEAVVGNIGSETRMEYTAIGDVVNVAARLEAIARPQQILTTDATRRAAGDSFEYADAGEHQLAGRIAPIHLYEVRP